MLPSAICLAICHFATRTASALRRSRKLCPGKCRTILADVGSGGGSTVRFARGRSAVFHVTVRDGSGVLHARFFHGGYLEGRLKEGQRLVLHGKVGCGCLPARAPGNGESANRTGGRERQGSRGFHRSGPHRSRLRSDRRNQFANAAAHHLQRAGHARKRHSRSACRRKFANDTAFPRGARRCCTRIFRRRTKISNC